MLAYENEVEELIKKMINATVKDAESNRKNQPGFLKL
jgi:hypothetical protein